MRCIPLLVLTLLLAGCGDPEAAPGAGPAGGDANGSPPAGDSDSPGTPQPFTAAHRLALAEARCLACHGGGAADPAGIAALPGPSLAGLGTRVDPAWLVDRLLDHRVGSESQARDLAAYLISGSGEDAGLEAASVGAGRVAGGEALFGELGCRACHEAGGIEGLAAKTDFGSLVGFLADARATRPDLAFHDFRLEGGERAALAAWLLRDSLQDASEAPPVPGLHWECYEVQIDSAGRPALDGVTPSARGLTEAFDVKLGTRGNNFALRFHGAVEIPEAGTWRFVTGSDDSSWLEIDGQEVVRNEGLAPHRRRDGTVELGAGWHALEVLYTEAGGGESLEVLWQAPGADQPEVIPGAALSAQTSALVPPTDASGLDADAEAVGRGQDAYRTLRCGACHDGPTGAPDPTPATAWVDLRFGVDCSRVPGGAEVVAARKALALVGGDPSPTPAEQLEFAMSRDRCAACHSRDGSGGMRNEAVEQLVELEDLGDEGRLPPDLTAIGHRLRPEWTEAFLAGRESARSYVRARCVALPTERAADYAAWFDAVDGVEGDTEAPDAVDAAVVAEGRRIVGAKGFACIACHQVAGRPSLGPQGMDLTTQGRRLKPGWFVEWLGSPAELRPGTRMPTFWADPDAPEAAAQIEAVRAWSALGTAAPLPEGLAAAGGGQTVLQVGERPRLHGAFLAGLSAKTLAVGTPERTHYAWDLRHARLAWLWRGEFLDAAGTWNGRAGKLVEPVDKLDWVVLPDGPSFESTDPEADPARVIGRTMDADGYPAIRYAVGTARVLDHPRPRYGGGGTELVRRIEVQGGDVALRLPGADDRLRTTVDGERVTDALDLPSGSTVEVIYSW